MLFPTHSSSLTGANQPKPPAEATEPTSTLVLTAPGTRRFVDLRLTPGSGGRSGPARLYWGFAGTSWSPTPTSGRWEHAIDSRADDEHDPIVDEGSLEVLENGDVLERGQMVDPDNPALGLRNYEELWRDEVLAAAGQRVSVVLETTGGIVVRVGRWCQGILKKETGGGGREEEGGEKKEEERGGKGGGEKQKGEKKRPGGGLLAERWCDGERVFAVEEHEQVCADEVWERERELAVGQELRVAGTVWRVVQRCSW